MNRSRRGLWIALAALLLVACCCACLASAYFLWGDPLMEALGFY